MFFLPGPPHHYQPTMDECDCIGDLCCAPYSCLCDCFWDKVDDHYTRPSRREQEERETRERRRREEEEARVAAWRARQAANGTVDVPPVSKGDVVMPELNPTTEPSAPLIGDSGHTGHPILGTGDVIISQPSDFDSMPDVPPPSYEDATVSHYSDLVPGGKTTRFLETEI